MVAVCLVVQSVYDFDPRVRRKAEALVAAGYSVDVLALRPPGGTKRYVLNGVNVQTISLAKERGSLARYVFEYVMSFLWVLVRAPWQTRRRRYAVIDVNSLPDFLVFALIVSRWMGATLILDLHEITPEFYRSKYGMAEHSWVVRLLTYLEQASIRFADRVITINHPIEDLLVGRGLPRHKSTVIMNAADETPFSASSRAVLASTDRATGRCIFVYHGTLTSIYGLDIAIEALALAHHDLPGAELWILGSGPEQGALARLAEERGIASKVRLVGRVAPAEVPAWLRQCDIGILPIRQDVFLDFAFPNKLPEFIVAGLPVVVSRLTALRHYFSDDALLYVEPNDAVDLSRQMTRICGDPQLRDRLRQRAKEEYAPIRWDLMKARYLRLVAEAIGGRG